MSEVNSEEEIEGQLQIKLTNASPIKKGDFMTYSQLQKKINSVIPDEETVSYNTSGILNSQLTYSMSQFEKANLGKIKETNESQQSHFILDDKESIKKDEEIQKLKQQKDYQQKQFEELKITIEKIKVNQKIKLDEINDLANKKDNIICQLKQYELYAQEQQKMIDQKDKQLKDLKEQYDIRTYNLQQIIDDQTEVIKKLHKQISSSNKDIQSISSTKMFDKICLKQQQLNSQFEELSNLYDEVIPEKPQTPNSSKKQIIIRSPSKSIHLIPYQQNSEKKPELI